MKNIAYLFILFSLIFSGCNATQHCFQVGGTWDEHDLTGSFQYCFDMQQSKEDGRIALVESEKENKLTALTEKDIAKINDLLEKQPENQSNIAAMKESNPVKKLLNLLYGKKANNQ